MSANAINDMWLSRQIGPFVVDFYPEPEGEAVTLYVWRTAQRDSGYRIECGNSDQVKAVVAQVEAVA